MSSFLSKDKKGVLEVLGNKYSIEILELAAKDSVSAQELSEELSIPIATCYRRLEELTDAGLIKKDGVIIEDGSQKELYKTKTDSILISFYPDFKVGIREYKEDKLTSIWDDLKNPKENNKLEK